jgi:3-deoxy-D-manno-octulosonic-acid transferase
MYFAYSFLLTIGFLLMSPLFLLRREKYASGFSERLGNYPEFNHDGRKVIWLHCVSVGETNAARPLVEKLIEEFPDHRLIVSTTTKTGQDLAQKLFAGRADAVIYFPFDWKFSVKKALATYKPELILLMETEIWPRFIREAKLAKAKVAIVNGRLSNKSFQNYSKVRFFISKVLANVDLALMQAEPDAERIKGLGIDGEKVRVTGNLKFETPAAIADESLTNELRRRFAVDDEKPLIIAASTHHPEERWVIESLESEIGRSCRLLIAPRHPERFDDVEKLLKGLSYSYARRSSTPSDTDKDADIILLDTIGELSAAYPLAEVVFVGGSLISHGGQSVIEPAVHGKAIVSGPYTMNFDAVVREFVENDAIIQTKVIRQEDGMTSRLNKVFVALLAGKERREELGKNALAVASGSDRNATETTIRHLRSLVGRPE